MAHENKYLLRHAKAIRCCYSTLGEDVKVSNRLTAMRVRSETSVEELDEAVGGDYMELERHPETITVEVLSRLAKFYDVSMSSLLFCCKL